MPEDSDLKTEQSRELPVGAGLKNNHNTCYLNSVLQCLTYTAPLSRYMLSGEHSRKCPQTGLCMMCTMEAHITQVLNSSGKVIVPFGVLSRLHCIGPQFVLGFPQDPHVFLLGVLKAMHKSSTSGSGQNKETSLLQNLFQGCLEVETECGSCGTLSDTSEIYQTISVSTEGVDTLAEALEMYLNKPLKFDAAYRCQKCRKIQPGINNVAFGQNPKVLVFKLIPDDREPNKHVDYPEKLDIRPFMCQCSGKREIYELYGIVVHSAPDPHHCYSYIKVSDGQWYEMNDTSVTISDKSSALSQLVYMLFYINSSCKSEVNPRSCEMPKKRKLHKDHVEVPAKRIKLECPKKNQTPPPQSSVQEGEKQRKLDKGDRIVAISQELDSPDKNQTSPPQSSVQGNKKRKRLDMEEEIPAKRRKVQCPKKNQTSPPQSSVQRNKKRKRLDMEEEIPAKRRKVQCPKKNQTPPPQSSVQQCRKQKKLDKGDEIPAIRKELECPVKNKTPPPQSPVQEGEKQKKLDKGDEMPAVRQELKRLGRDPTSPAPSAVQKAKMREQLNIDEEIPAKRRKLECPDKNLQPPSQSSVQECGKQKKLDKGEEIPAVRNTLDCPDNNQTSPPQSSVQKHKKRKRLDMEEEIPAKRRKVQCPKKNQTPPPQSSVQEGEKQRKLLDKGDRIVAISQELDCTDKNQTSPPQSSVQENKKRKRLDMEEEIPAKRIKLVRSVSKQNKAQDAGCG